MKRHLILVLLLAWFYPACSNTSSVGIPIEMPVLQIPMSGEIAGRQSELSGLCWYKDYLVLLPQYPSRFSENGATGALFYIEKETLRRVIEGRQESVLPAKMEIHYDGLGDAIDGFEGFESICFKGDQVFLTIESSGSGMSGYLIKGRISENPLRIDLDTADLMVIPPQADIDNASDETILISNNRIYTIYEGNGRNVNARPVAHAFDFDLNPIAEVPFPTIEYRVTDATGPAADNTFWVVNYFWPGDAGAYRPAVDELALQFGKGMTHSRYQSVERLIEMKVTENGIFLSDKAPIQLQLIGDDDSRNWEGIVQFENEGFLICTDYFPETMLGFVRLP